eukprot:1134823-Rhodomonas_salina.1
MCCLARVPAVTHLVSDMRERAEPRVPQRRRAPGECLRRQVRLLTAVLRMLTEPWHLHHDCRERREACIPSPHDIVLWSNLAHPAPPDAARVSPTGCSTAISNGSIAPGHCTTSSTHCVLGLRPPPGDTHTHTPPRQPRASLRSTQNHSTSSTELTWPIPPPYRHSDSNAAAARRWHCTANASGNRGRVTYDSTHPASPCTSSRPGSAAPAARAAPRVALILHGPTRFPAPAIAFLTLGTTASSLSTWGAYRTGMSGTAPTPGSNTAWIPLEHC